VQSYEAEYRSDASPDILKWKPASHNSVDFTLLPVEHRIPMANKHCLAAADQGQDYFLGVYSQRQVVIAYDVRAGAKGVLEPTTTPAKVSFPEGESPEKYIGMVIECTFKPETRTWHFMRERSKCAFNCSTNT
jgi:hypothetical protein